MTPLHANSIRHQNQNQEEPNFDIEAARRELESLLMIGSASVEDENSSNKNEKSEKPAISRRSGSISSSPPPAAGNNIVIPPPPKLDHSILSSLAELPPLTTIGRERLLAERNWISQLLTTTTTQVENDDGPLKDLNNLWYSERGTKAQTLLQTADNLISSPSNHDWDRAEGILRSLIAQYGLTFCEPWYRLATLFGLQGRHIEALSLYQTVLSIKPWHFGALSGVVRAYEGMGDMEHAREWAAFRLPRASQVNRRRQWVERALRDLDATLKAAEQRNVEAFGRGDPHVDDVLQSRLGDEDKDAWQ
jgi:hypothetical protein